MRGGAGQYVHGPPVSQVLSWAWRHLNPHRAHARVLLTFGIGHCICAGHTVQRNQVPGAGSLQCRAAVSETPGHSLTWAAHGTASFTKPSGIYFQDSPALGTAPRHTPHLDPSPAHWGRLIPWVGPALTEHTAGLVLCLGCVEETESPGTACREPEPAG